MNYYDLTDEQRKAMGVDSDFCACLEYNPQPFNLSDVDRVLAVIEGKRDEADWHWVVKLRNDRIAYVRGGCDYTGWNCRSSADTVFLSEDKKLVDAIQDLSPDCRDEDIGEFFVELSNQIKNGKKETWREKKDRGFGLQRAKR